jgi:hypothetical protein
VTPEQVRDLIDALELHEHYHGIEAVLLTRVKDFESGEVGISIAATDDTDWVTQLGIIRGAEIITTANLHRTTGDD